MLSVDDHVRVHGDRPLPRRHGLPEVRGVPKTEWRVLDAIGHTVRDHWPAGIAAVLGAGAMFAVTRGRSGSGLAKLTTAGLAGALAGGATMSARALLSADPAHAPTREAKDRKRAKGELRVMSFNVREGFGPTGYQTKEAALDRIAEVVRREHPDVVLLQEVGDFSPLSGFHDQLEVLAERLHPTSAVSAMSGRRISGRGKGTAVFTFNGHKIDDARNLRIDDANGEGVKRRIGGVYGMWRELRQNPETERKDLTGYHPRNAIDALVVTPQGQKVRVVSTHLSGVGAYSGGNRTNSQRDQLDPLAAALGQWDGPTVLAGDFNVGASTDEGDREREVLGAAGLVDVADTLGLPHDSRERISLPDRNDPTTGKRLDRIYASRGLDVRRMHVAESTASDHRPVVADIVLPSAETTAPN